DRAARLQALRVHTKAMPLASDVSLERLAARTEHYTGADLELVAVKAALAAGRRNKAAKALTPADLDAALGEGKPSVTPAEEREYAALVEQFSRGRTSGQKRRPIGLAAWPAEVQ